MNIKESYWVNRSRLISIKSILDSTNYGLYKILYNTLLSGQICQIPALFDKLSAYNDGPEIFLVKPTFDNPNKKLLKVTNSLTATLISTLVIINNLVTHNQMYP